MFVLVACTNNFSGLLAFDFAMVTALGWGEMGGGIFWILLLVSLLQNKLLASFSNYLETFALREAPLVLALRWSYPASYIAEINSQAARPISWSCRKLLTSFLWMLLCLIKVAMCCREHAILLTLPVRNLLVLNNEVTVKFPSQSCGSASILVLYRITEVPIGQVVVERLFVSLLGWGSAYVQDGCVLCS